MSMPGWVDDELAAVLEYTTIAPSHDEISRLAYALWEARGGGDGSSEQDWLEAERQLQAKPFYRTQ